MTQFDRDRMELVVKRLEAVRGALNARNATVNALRHLEAADRLADGLADVWTAAGEPGNWDRTKAEVAVADYQAPEVPTSNWPHGQGIVPMPPQLLQEIRDRNQAVPDATTTALLDEVDRLAYQVRIWHFNHDGATATIKRMHENQKRTQASAKATIGRVWKLIDRTRKTVPMDALRSALTGDEESAPVQDALDFEAAG